MTSTVECGKIHEVFGNVRVLLIVAKQITAVSGVFMRPPVVVANFRVLSDPCRRDFDYQALSIADLVKVVTTGGLNTVIP